MTKSMPARRKTSAGIRPIKTEADYDAALAEIERLWGAKSSTPDGDRLDVLATLVEAYEDKHHAIDAPSPIAAIEFRMEQLGLKRKDLEPLIGNRARVSEILSGKRNLTLAMIRRLHDVLDVPLEALIKPSISKRQTTSTR
jgi:HTH-type transcriptional regulator / antitoxin HigA